MRLGAQYTGQAICAVVFGAALQAQIVRCDDWTIFTAFYLNIFTGGLYLIAGVVIGHVYEQEKLKRVSRRGMGGHDGA